MIIVTSEFSHQYKVDSNQTDYCYIILDLSYMIHSLVNL